VNLPIENIINKASLFSVYISKNLTIKTYIKVIKMGCRKPLQSRHNFENNKMKQELSLEEMRTRTLELGSNDAKDLNTLTNPTLTEMQRF
jgi:hypothetical protein